MEPIDRLQRDLADFVEELRSKSRSQASAMRQFRLPSETFKSIRKGHLPADPAVRARLAKMLGYTSTDALFGPHEGGHLGEGVGATGNDSLTNVTDPGGPGEDRAMKEELDEIEEIYRRLGSEDRVLVLQYLRGLDRVRVAKEAARTNPTERRA